MKLLLTFSRHVPRPVSFEVDKTDLPVVSLPLQNTAL